MKKSILVILIATALVLTTVVGIGVAEVVSNIPVFGEYKLIDEFVSPLENNTITLSTADVKNIASQPFETAYSIKINAKNESNTQEFEYITPQKCDYYIYWLEENVALVREKSEYSSDYFVVEFSDGITCSFDGEINTEMYEIVSTSGFSTLFSDSQQYDRKVFETENDLLYIFVCNGNTEEYSEYNEYNYSMFTEVTLRKDGEEKFSGTMQVFDESIVVVKIDKMYKELIIK